MERPPRIPPLPPAFKNISWTISTCPHPGQLLLLTNYRLGNPVTNMASVLREIDRVSRGRWLGQGQTTAEQVDFMKEDVGSWVPKLLWLTCFESIQVNVGTKPKNVMLYLSFKKVKTDQNTAVLVVTSALHRDRLSHASILP